MHLEWRKLKEDVVADEAFHYIATQIHQHCAKGDIRLAIALATPTTRESDRMVARLRLFDMNCQRQRCKAELVLTTEFRIDTTVPEEAMPA